MTGRSTRRVGTTGLLVAVLLLGVLAGGTWLAWADGRLNTVVCGGPCGPRAVAAPEGLAVPGPLGDRTALGPGAGTLDAARVRAALEPLLDDDDLGDRVTAVVLDPRAPEEPLLARGDAAFVPASTTKVLTAFAALSLGDPAERFSTTVVRDGDRIVLVGGGDPYLSDTRPRQRTAVDRADLRTLARRTAAALRREGVGGEVGLGFDAGLFTGPAQSPAWESDYVSGQVVTPVSALWADRGIRDGIRSATPARAAADRFARHLEDAGVEVAGDPEATAAPDSPPIARVLGPTLAQAVEAMLVRSDNEAAEVLLRHAAIAAGEPASFSGGAAAVQDVLATAGVPVDGLELTDGSGLSRANRIGAGTLAHTLAAAVSEPRTAGLLGGLPVGGFTGTLEDRFPGSSRGAGVVRAKTGTLTGVHSLAGVAIDRRGVPIVFAVMTDDTEDVPPLETQAAIDDVAAALAACRCG